MPSRILTKLILCLTVATTLLSGLNAQSATSDTARVDLRELKFSFKTKTDSTVVTVSRLEMQRISAQGSEAYYQVFPYVITIGCVTYTKRKFKDTLCRGLNDTEFTMAADQATASINFSGKGIKSKRVFTVRVTAPATSDPIRTPVVEPSIPRNGNDPAGFYAAVLSIRRAKATGSVSVSKVGTIKITNKVVDLRLTNALTTAQYS